MTHTNKMFARMFTIDVYNQRRQRLKKALGSGVVLLPGNAESPMNYRDNAYPFRQDSTFLYYFGLDRPGLNAVIDIDADRTVIYGDDPGPNHHIWSGPQPSISQSAQMTGVTETRPAGTLALDLEGADKKQDVHFLPPYRAEHEQRLQQLFGLTLPQIQQRFSPDLIKAVVAQRSIKAEQEIEQIESALTVTRKMHLVAMEMTRPGVFEYEVVGAMQSAAYALGGFTLAYPSIFSVRGEIMHNSRHDNRMRAGQLAVNDTGAQSVMHYAGDITRTLPVSGSFTPQQKDIYGLVLKAQEQAIASLKPGVRFLDVHLATARCLTQGLKDIGLMRGDPDEMVTEGAHALFFPHGLGHMLGLDVHDMENLGEDAVGYNEKIQRSSSFGLSSLRLARDMQPGFVVTVEPGLYFIPALIDLWRTEGRFAGLINYSELEAYREFGGVRIEDDILITADGCRVLGPPVPKTIKELTRP